MQRVEQKQNESLFFEKIRVEQIEPVNCFQIREKLDELFSGDLLFEEMPLRIKRHLFIHLESCRDCCRAFDTRIRFRPGGRNRIF